MEHVCRAMYAHGGFTVSDALEHLEEPVSSVTPALQACFGCSAVKGARAGARLATAPTVILDTTVVGCLAERV